MAESMSLSGLRCRKVNLLQGFQSLRPHVWISIIQGDLEGRNRVLRQRAEQPQGIRRIESHTTILICQRLDKSRDGRCSLRPNVAECNSGVQADKQIIVFE